MRLHNIGAGNRSARIALRVALLVACVLLATWASHQVRESLHFQVMAENEQMMHRAIMAGSAAYVVLLAIPFVPGAEIGLAMLMAFGAAVAPLVYAATVLAMLLSYLLGRLLPIEVLARLLSFLRLGRAADLVRRAAPLSRQERLALLLEGAPPRMLAWALRHRYVALAVLVNLPGNAIFGGGGGIMMMAGLSGLFAPLPTVLAVAAAVSPIPLAFVFFGA